MSQYSIEGANQVKKILTQLRPFIQFKKRQAEIILKVIETLRDNGLNKELLLEISRLYDKLAQCSYISHRRKYTGETIRNVVAKIDS